MDRGPQHLEDGSLNHTVSQILESCPQLSAAPDINRCLGSACSQSLTKAPRQKLFSIAGAARLAFIVAAAVFAI
jgi:hypothetical protein